MRGAQLKQLFHARSQITGAHSVEVIEGEEVKVLSQVTRQDVKLVQHSKAHTCTHTHTHTPFFSNI